MSKAILKQIKCVYAVTYNTICSKQLLTWDVQHEAYSTANLAVEAVKATELYTSRLATQEAIRLYSTG